MSETIGSDGGIENQENHVIEEQVQSPVVAMVPDSMVLNHQEPSPVFVRAPTSLPIIPNPPHPHNYSSPVSNPTSISPLPPPPSTTARSASPSFAKNVEHSHSSVNGSMSTQPKPPQHPQRYHYHHAQQLVAPQRQHGNNVGAMQSSASSSPSNFFPNVTSSYEEQRLTNITGPGSQYVKLNVGGSLHYTTIATLTKQPDSMLRAMFSGRLEVLTDAEGWILIDRCGKHFPLILNYLRDSNVALPESRREVMEILAEAKYYCLQGLVDLCSAWLELSQRVEEEPAVCRVPIITTSKEEKALIQSTTKPVVKLLLNRHNNKYSYTPQSDDNLLKNLELFDKLVLRFHERVMVIKDVGAANEVCSWSFYGHGKKVGEVCCTSIVYATDKKHTKVEFPEARIYEEAMNILLYEPPVMCSMCQSVACQSSTCAGMDSPETASSPCCAGDCERIQLEKLQKARTAVRVATSGSRGECSGSSGHGTGGNSV